MATKLDARRDDWDTEVLSDAAIVQLNVLQQLLQELASPDAQVLESLVAPDFAGTSLRPTELTESYRDGLITVRRSAREATAGEAGIQGATGLQQAIATLTQALGTGDERHTKFKLYRIWRGRSFCHTRALRREFTSGDRRPSANGRLGVPLDISDR